MPRLIETLLVLLLFVFGLGVVLQWQNQKLLDAILVEMKNRREIAVADPPHPTAPAPQAPANGPQGVQRTHPNSPPDDPTTTPATPATPASPPPKVDIIGSDPPRPPVAPERPSPTDPAPQTTPPAPVDPPATPAPTAGDTAQWRELGPLVEQTMGLLLSGEYKSAIERFDPRLRAELSEPVIASVIDPLRKEHGSMKRIATHERVTENVADRQTAFRVVVEMTDGFEVQFTITIDDRRRITALF